ncbi:MAG: galactokinase, partial [Chloroflexi bacterium]|nr:galactokinase [Chloroflexota bacterium]
GRVPPNALPSWVRYPAGVAWALVQAGHEACGLRGVYASSVPIGAGLSSSAAVEAVFALAWQSTGGWPASPMDLARLCQHAENDFVGVRCGLMDQFAAFHGARGQALLFDCRLLTWEAVPIPPQVVIVVADSGVRRLLGASAYNQRRSECDQAVHLLRQRIPGIRALRDVTPEMFAEHAVVLPGVIRRRAQHVVDECLRARLMADALRAADLPRAGELLNASHASLRTLYEVSGPELDALVEAARRQPGCFGARLTGAGFGGCTVQLVDASRAEEFTQSLADDYQRATGRRAEVMVTAAAQGAQVLRHPA